MFILKTIYKVKIIDLKKQIIQSELKSGNLRLKYFLFETYEVAKSSHEDKKIEKVQICQNVPRPLSDIVKWYFCIMQLFDILFSSR